MFLLLMLIFAALLWIGAEVNSIDHRAQDAIKRLEETNYKIGRILWEAENNLALRHNEEGAPFTQVNSDGENR